MFKIRLKELRENENLSQQKFANILCISQGTVGNWESGIREPNFETTIKIAKYFNVSIDYLLGNTDTLSTPKISAIEKSKIDTLFSKLNSLGKDKAESYIIDLLDNPKYVSEEHSSIPSLEEAMRLQKGTPLRTDRLGHDDIIHKAAFGGGVWEEKKDK